MRIYNLYNIWKLKEYNEPHLGESFIGSGQVEEFLTIGNSSEKSPLDRDQIETIRNDTKHRKSGEPVVSNPEADALIVPEYEVK